MIFHVAARFVAFNFVRWRCHRGPCVRISLIYRGVGSGVNTYTDTHHHRAVALALAVV